MKKKQKKLVLLNSEGPVLKAVHTEDGYVLYDTHDGIVDILSQNDMKKFIHGEMTIFYTDGREMCYPYYSNDMKAKPDDLRKFLGL